MFKGRRTMGTQMLNVSRDTIMPQRTTLLQKKVQDSISAQERMEDVDTSDLQQFVNIYLEEVKMAENNYQALLKIAVNDLNTLRK